MIVCSTYLLKNTQDEFKKSTNLAIIYFVSQLLTFKWCFVFWWKNYKFCEIGFHFKTTITKNRLCFCMVGVKNQPNKHQSLKCIKFIFIIKIILSLHLILALQRRYLLIYFFIFLMTILNKNTMIIASIWISLVLSGSSSLFLEIKG